MNAPNTYAWISGSAMHGYRLHIESCPATAEFAPFNLQWFTLFKAAQTIATAVNKYAKAQPRHMQIAFVSGSEHV
jgi:hypothetical protein